ncbi:baeRF3 domain-containing protein [Streptomyces gardneri]|uniref:baeRF3 domain-containing protein n=1 Tax=Streptomyces gardneri TaxID=66892 RepID=UPI0037D63C85
MDPQLTSDQLAELRRPRPYPALSVLMPTHRREPEKAQDAVRLRNLVAQAEKALENDPDVPRERRGEMVDRLRRAVAELDPTHAQDGLVIFVAQGEHHVWSVARVVPERVVLSDTFLTRNLVAAQAAEQPYWALAVAADRISLWDGSPEQATEYSGDGFPLARSLEDPDAERKQRIGDLPSTFQDEATRRFLREGHDKLRAVLARTPRPLYVLGSAAALSLLEEIGPLGPGAVSIQHGGLADGPAGAVAEAVEPVRTAREAATTATIAAELEAARGRREFAGGLDEVWQAVQEGRVRLLAVEEHYRTVVREKEGHLEPADAGQPGARDDMVDEIVEQALERGAEIRFVPDDALAGQGHIAGVLRY